MTRRGSGRESDRLLGDEMLWVLRNARSHASEPALRSGSGFAAGAGRADPVNRSQIGRWERGEVGVTHGLVRRYETVLALPEGQLSCVIDTFARGHRAVRSTAMLTDRAEPDVDVTLLLLERALSSERMTGTQWDRLSDNLGRMPHVLVRASDWEALISRCLSELAVSLRLGYAQRAEAVARLAGHPRSGPVVARMAGDVMGDPATQFWSDTVSLLQFTDHPDALRVLMTQLRSPTGDDALRACLLSLTSIVQTMDLPSADGTEAVALALGLLRDASLPYRVHRGAANLLRAAGVAQSGRLALALSSRDRAFVASILLDGRAVRPSLYRGAHKRIRSRLERAPGWTGEHEPVLDGVIRTALAATNEEDRAVALTILMISPQGHDVAREYAVELARGCATADIVAVQECLSVLSWLQAPEDIPLFLEMATAPATAPDVVMELGFVLGNVSDQVGPDDVLERRVADLIRTVVGGPARPGVVDQLRGLAYVLGMRARFDLIDGLHDEFRGKAHDRPNLGPARTSLDWWRTLPAHIRPVRRAGHPPAG